MRYRHDKQKQRRLTTVEPIIDDGFSAPSNNIKKILTPSGNQRPVLVRVNYHEIELRQKVKQAGGKWDPERKRWLLDARQADRLVLASRIEDI